MVLLSRGTVSIFDLFGSRITGDAQNLVVVFLRRNAAVLRNRSEASLGACELLSGASYWTLHYLLKE